MPRPLSSTVICSFLLWSCALLLLPSSCSTHDDGVLRQMEVEAQLSENREQTSGVQVQSRHLTNSQSFNEGLQRDLKSRLPEVTDDVDTHPSEISTERTRPLESTARVSVRPGRGLKLFSLITDGLDLNIGGPLLGNGPNFSLETPDLAIGLEGLFGSFLKTTLATLANQAAGSLLNPGVLSGGSDTPQRKGVQQQYQLQFARGPWNVQSGLQIGIQAEDDPSGTFFLDQSFTDVSSDDPQTVFQQANDIYYGQAFSEGYSQGFSQGSQSLSMGTPSGTLPALASSSPTGYNEGVVAGFTRGLQDGYYAGFQSAQTTRGLAIPSYSTISPQNSGITTTTLPHALPHVSPNGPLPQDLYAAQQKATLQYTKALEDRIRNLENTSKLSENIRNRNDRTDADETDEEMREYLRSKREIKEQELRSREEEDAQNKEDHEAGSETADSDETRTAQESESEEMKIVGMSVFVAALVFSGLLFILVLSCWLCLGVWMKSRKAEKTPTHKDTKVLKSKTSDMSQVSAYMTSPSMFDEYINPIPKPSKALRTAGTRE